MVDVEEVAENIYMIDDRVCSISKLGSVYLLDEEKKALVDSGPPSSASAVLEGIKKIGVKAEDINYIIVTHIHLDHAGGTGVLLERMPQAQVLVHYKGAKHLVKLTELMESATRTQGRRIIAQYGEVVPVEPERVGIIHDNDVIQLSGEQVLDFIDAPGHAPHELCIFEKRNRGIFVGDALGLYLADGEVLLPCHPPPSFDVEMSISTIKRLMTLNASQLYFAHFGASGRAQETLQMAIDQIQVYAGMVAAAVSENGLDGVAERLSKELRPALEPLKKQPAVYKLVSEDLLPSGINGFINYYSKKHKN
jgi:glyoxylase-like metal-dependent hydrolase (beta-lactamase superfamily II)